MKTSKGYTETTEGKIPHLPYRGIMLPVRIVPIGRLSSQMATWPHPMRDARGRLIYALPGGGMVAI